MRSLLFISVIIVAILLSTSGCEQKFCCGSVTEHYICVRYPDTAVLDISGSLSDVHARLADSLSYYQGMGYACQDNQDNKGPSWWPSCVIGIIHRKQAINGGDSCGTPDLRGLCNANGGCD